MRGVRTPPSDETVAMQEHGLGGMTCGWHLLHVPRQPKGAAHNSYTA